MPIPVIAVVGPTASGKTALAVELAKKYNGEIISADSMQIYKNLNIATAKPTVDEMQEIKHYCLDFLSPAERFSVSDFVKLAKEAIAEITSKGKLPIIAGGTGLYIDTLLNGIKLAEFDTDLNLRKKLFDKAEKVGTAAMYEYLKGIDEASALKIEKNDLKRIIRAIEVFETSGITKSQLDEMSKREKSQYLPTYIGLNTYDRKILYDRINLRVDKMLEAGLIQEAESFYKMFSPDTAGQAIGYKEIKPYLDGRLTLEECTENLKRATRRYAKRQLTWFRKNEKINWIYIDNRNFNEIFIEACKIVEDSNVK